MRADRLERRQRLARALKRVKGDEEISLTNLAHLWNVTKARFVNVKAAIPNFPDPSSKDSKDGALNYPARTTIQVLIDWEHRDDKIKTEKAERHRRLVGIQADAPAEEVLIPPSELLKYDQLATSIQKRKIDQGELLKAKEVHDDAAQAFSKISAAIGQLANSLDPNGILDAEMRGKLDDLGRKLLFGLYNDMSKLFGPDTQPDPDQPRSIDEARKSRRHTRS